MSETQNLSDEQKEKVLILKIIRKILTDLNKDFPWLVIENAISFQERLGEKNLFVTAAFDGILEDMSQEFLDKYLPECVDHGVLASDAALHLETAYNSAELAEVLARPAFSLDPTIPDECAPWDKDEESLSFYDMNDKTLIIQKIKMDLRELAMYRGIIARNSDAFKDEIIAIDTVFEILNFSIV